MNWYGILWHEGSYDIHVLYCIIQKVSKRCILCTTSPYVHRVHFTYKHYHKTSGFPWLTFRPTPRFFGRFTSSSSSSADDAYDWRDQPHLRPAHRIGGMLWAIRVYAYESTHARSRVATTSSSELSSSSIWCRRLHAGFVPSRIADDNLAN